MKEANQINIYYFACVHFAFVVMGNRKFAYTSFCWFYLIFLLIWNQTSHSLENLSFIWNIYWDLILYLMILELKSNKRFLCLNNSVALGKKYNQTALNENPTKLL